MRCAHELLHLLHLNENIGRVATESAGALVNHDAAVRQCEASTWCASGKKYCTHGHGDAGADGAHWGSDVPHRVVNREAGGDHTPWAVDVERDLLLGIL